MAEITKAEINKSTGGVTIIVMPNGGALIDLRIPKLAKDKKALLNNLKFQVAQLEDSLR